MEDPAGTLNRIRLIRSPAKLSISTALGYCIRCAISLAASSSGLIVMDRCSSLLRKLLSSE